MGVSLSISKLVKDNLVFQLGLITVIYFFGYSGWSVAWLYCVAIALTLTGRWSKEKRERWNVARAMALGFEKEILLTKLQFLPSWVHFPDIERVEWVNRIIRQVWCRVNHYTRDLVPRAVEPAVQKHIKSFKFDEVVLGHVPFRIDGVKVYDEDISRNKIVMDLDISYAGDCRITFQVAGMTGGIEDFQLRGRLRVVMKPLISSIPLVGGLQVYFMNEPEIDFDLSGVAQLLAIPGLRTVLQNAVLEAINKKLLFPNMFPIKLSDKIKKSELKIFEPEGVLRVHVVEAKHLMKKDIGLLGSGKSDPYAIVTVGSMKIRTKTIDNTVDPKWDYWCEFEAESNWDLSVHVWDRDDGSKDETLGRATMGIGQIAKKGQDDLWVPLQEVMHGMIHLRLYWLTLSQSGADLDVALDETKIIGRFVHSSLLMVYLDSAKKLQQTKSSNFPDPYVIVQVEKAIDQTDVKAQTCNPVWEQGFTFMIYNPKTANLRLTVVDKKTGNEMGELSYSLSMLLDRTNLEIRNQPLVLAKAGPDCTVMCSLKLRIFKNEAIDEAPTETKSDTKEEELEIPRPTPRPLVKQGTSDSIQSSVSSTSTESSKVGSTLTSRNSASSLSDSSSVSGSIRLTLRYSVPRRTLVVIIHEVANIRIKNPTSLPDPYVKMYVLPRRGKDSKKKTRKQRAKSVVTSTGLLQVVRDTCNPNFDETFEYLMTSTELGSMKLEIKVATEKKPFHIGSNTLGLVIIDLGERNLTKTYSAWFDIKSKYDLG